MRKFSRKRFAWDGLVVRSLIVFHNKCRTREEARTNRKHEATQLIIVFTLLLTIVFSLMSLTYQNLFQIIKNNLKIALNCQLGVIYTIIYPSFFTFYDRLIKFHLSILIILFSFLFRCARKYFDSLRNFHGESPALFQVITHRWCLRGVWNVSSRKFKHEKWINDKKDHRLISCFSYFLGIWR